MFERPLILVGADTIAGESVLTLLAETEMVSGVVGLGMDPTDDATFEFAGESLPVQHIGRYNFTAGEVVICVGDAALAELTIDLAGRAGALVLDATGFSRSQEFAQIVHPGINPEALAQLQQDGVTAVPGSVGMALAPLLRACRQLGTVARIDIHCTQSVSCYGSAGIRELAEQTNRLLNGLSVESPVFGEQIAFNLLPATGALAGDINTAEQEILALAGFECLPININSIIAPVFYGQVFQVSITFEWDVDARDAIDLWEEIPSVRVVQDAEYPLSPVAFARLDDEERKLVHVYDIAVREARKNILNLSVVMDNGLAGSASGVVKLYQQLVTGFLG